MMFKSSLICCSCWRRWSDKQALNHTIYLQVWLAAGHRLIHLQDRLVLRAIGLSVIAH